MLHRSKNGIYKRDTHHGRGETPGLFSMRLYQPQIAVIADGILGSAITYSLAIRGADVLLLDQNPRPGCGVTGRAFGWVNVINGTPFDTSYALWREAVAEFQLLKAVLPQALSDALLVR